MKKILGIGFVLIFQSFINQQTFSQIASGIISSTANNEIILTKGSKQPGVYLFNLTNERTGERANGEMVIE